MLFFIDIYYGVANRKTTDRRSNSTNWKSNTDGASNRWRPKKSYTGSTTESADSYAYRK